MVGLVIDDLMESVQNQCNVPLNFFSLRLSIICEKKTHCFIREPKKLSLSSTILPRNSSCVSILLSRTFKSNLLNYEKKRTKEKNVHIQHVCISWFGENKAAQSPVSAKGSSVGYVINGCNYKT